MAKKYWDGDITLDTDWGGDSTTNNLPVLGSRVQEVIKSGINSKVGYVGRIERTGQGFYVLARDEKTFLEYEKTITEDNPFGDTSMDGIVGRFDAPFNYKMDITLLGEAESGYISDVIGSTNNIIKFTAKTLDSSNTPQMESITVTFKVKTEGGVESSYTAIYDGLTASTGIEYNLDGKLASGVNTITITAVGMNTGVSSMSRIVFRLVDMYFIDKFDIAKRYQFNDDGTLSINVGYSLKGVGKTRLLWYFDGNPYAEDVISNSNPNLQNTNRAFYFTKSTAEWLTAGVHNLQVTMVCVDDTNGSEYHTPIYYREFIVEENPTILEEPFIVRKTSFDYSKGFLENNETPTIYGARQFENVTIEYAAYFNGKSECNVTTYLKNGSTTTEISSESLPMVLDGFSAIQKKSINLTHEGIAEISLIARGLESDFTAKFNVEVNASDMDISMVTNDLVLSLNAFGRSNNSSNRESWDYVDASGKTITTDFSKNEYVEIEPSDADETNTKEVDSLPVNENEEYKYLKFDGKYYIWNRKFDWSNTSGWSDNKLKLSNGNSITINYMPFSSDKINSLKENGGTYEFEFETTKVYNDDAVICRICGDNNNAPGISIYASGAELVISRTVDTPVYDENGELININAGYIKAVNTKYKAEESNRISFVITPDGETNADGSEYRNRILKIYVNGELCGAYPYDKGANFLNDSKITFRGSEEACVNISSIQIYQRALTSNEILGNYIYFRNDVTEKAAIYKRNNVMLDNNNETFDSDKLKSQLPVMMIYQIDKSQSLDDIHQEKKNKKLTRYFDVVYTNIQDPSKNFLVKNAYITPQGTSSMNYPVKNLRLYTGKKDDNGDYYSRLFVGSNIFKDGSANNISWDNINLETEVTGKRKYAFKDGSAPVNCWCLKADFAESSSSHNTGTARFWNNVLKTNGYTTKAQVKAEKVNYKYDVRTCIDGFPITVFYQPLGNSAPRFEGKYNFNNDKSTEDVFGFTGGDKIDTQEVRYFYIGKNRPIIHSETNENNEVEYACSFKEGVSKEDIESPTTDSPLYVSDTEGNWYMLRGKELLDNPKMECWELLNSVNEMALFKTAAKFTVGDGDEKIGLELENGFDEAFESRYPDCGDYYHYNSLKRFIEWLVSCRYLDIDSTTGECVPFKQLPLENYHLNNETERLLSICSLSKQKGTITFDFPGVNFYREVEYETIKSAIKEEGYQAVNITDNDILASLVYLEVTEIPKEKIEGYDYLKCKNVFYTWLPSNLLTTDEIPNIHEVAYDFIKVGETYYIWDNTYKLEDYHETQWVDDSAFNRALKFAIEKYDHIEMEKMAAYYIYLMRFGGVDQTVKNSMLTTEGPATDDPESTLPSLWYFINYDNDTILGVKNDGRLVFDPYITRQTKDGTGYVYAGRESTLWNNLEADIQFMETVTRVDNVLAKGEKDSQFALSYNNAIREYDTNQSDKWCERIYNKDAERKYIQTYVDGWVQKVAADNSETHVFEDYLYDVHGSRSAHRKWWLGRRFNVFDSRFCNTNFMNSLIKFRSTNLPAGAEIKIKSGEPIFYAWGHDNTVTEMTPTAIQPGDYYTFTTKSAFNIGSYLELMGAANIATLDLRGCVGALTEIDITGCYSSSIGTKMKEIIIGDNTRNDLINISNTNMKFSGLDKATKLEYLDITNIRNIMALDGLNSLLNIRELYAEGSSVANFTFADGAMIETLRLPSTIETLSLTRSSLIDYNGISFENDTYSALQNLTIDNCPQLMTDASFVLDWIASIPEDKLPDLTLNLQGIDWTFDSSTLNKLFLLKNVGISGNGRRNIRGKITINSRINNYQAVELKTIFGSECFKEGSIVYISAPPALYINMPEDIWEGQSDVRCDIITIGAKLGGELTVTATVQEEIDGEIKEKLISNTDGNIVMDASNLFRDYITYSVKENNNIYNYLFTKAVYRGDGQEYSSNFTSIIKKRIYPNKITIVTASDSFNNKDANKLRLNYTPENINNGDLEGRGNFKVQWELVSGTTDYDNKLETIDFDKEVAKLKAPNGWDGVVTVRATVIREFDKQIMCSTEKQLEFKNPDTIITEMSNPVIYNILKDAGIIKVNADGYGKLTQDDASKITMSQLVNENGKSIFAENTGITSFTEFQWFTSNLVGQMPQEGRNDTLTPDGMFSGCTNLVEIAFPYGFEYTGKNMFVKCTNLKHIYGNSQNNDEDGNPIYLELGFKSVGDGFASGCTNLETCVLSSNLEYIGTGAFTNCSKLTEFNIPTSNSLVITYNQNLTPFSKCNNITFIGSEYSSLNNLSKYQVKDGSLYEVNGDTLTLIHMGKNSLMENIPSDKIVYACAHSMESRNESHLVIPENIIFNGSYILTQSKGESIKINTIIGNNVASNLMDSTSFNGNYKFAIGETTIPSSCFSNVNDLKQFIVPEGVTSIKNNAFYPCSNLVELSLPTTLTSIGERVFWLCNSLKIIHFNSSTPPTFQSQGDFFNVTPNVFYVNPEYYNDYCEFYNTTYPLITPFFKINKLFNEGYLRIIKDGAFLFSDENNVVKVGNTEVIVEDGTDYMKYIVETPDDDVNVYLETENGTTVIGQIDRLYTTIYIGDNSSLFSGDGVNFEIGIFDNETQNIINNSGWFYEKRFKGIRSSMSYNRQTEITLSLPSYANKPTNIIYGRYSSVDTTNKNVFDYIKNSNNIEIYKNLNSLGYNQQITVTTNDGVMTFGFNNTQGIHTGIDGIVLNKIGDSIYSDPELIGKRDMSTKMITINLNCNTNIPDNVYVTLSDNKNHIYRKYWHGEPLTFVVPSNCEFYADASEFVSEKHKKFMTNGPIKVDTDNIIINYTSRLGIELHGNLIYYYGTDSDWFVDTTLYNDSWGSLNTDIESVNVSEILTSDTNGYNNTILIGNNDVNSICAKCLKNKIFDSNICEYIPSFVEYELFNNILPEINNFLITKNKKQLSIDNCWVSESFDSNNAWTTNGNYELKNTKLNYLIFGRYL